MTSCPSLPTSTATAILEQVRDGIEIATRIVAQLHCVKV